MSTKSLLNSPLFLLRSAFSSLFNNPVLLFPLSIVAFVQLLFMEVIFFAPRYPLSKFFGPMIAKVEGDVFIHYPFNFLLLTKWFQKIQAPVYVVLTVYCLAVTVVLVQYINSGKKIKVGDVFKKVLGSYVHLLVFGILAVSSLYLFSHLYSMLFERASQMRSDSGIFFMLKQTVIMGRPYFNLFFAVLITTLFSFVIPSIVLENKKIHTAIFQNFRYIKNSFLFIFTVILLPSLLYVPILLLGANSVLFREVLAPDAWAVVLVFSIFVLLFIDAIQYVAVTTFYLLKKEMS